MGEARVALRGRPAEAARAGARRAGTDRNLRSLAAFNTVVRERSTRTGLWRAPRAQALAILTTLALAALTGSAAGDSGGSGVPSGTPSPPPPTSSTPAGAFDFTGRGMWIWYVSASNGGRLSSIIATAHRYHLNTLMIKAGDGSSPWSQFNASLVSQLHAAGLRVCAWQYVYGTYPVAEARVGAAAVKDGADCLLIDAESQYEGKYVPAQTYISHLRKAIGPDFPLALAGFPYVDYHPGFPYSVFLGPGGAQYNVPQMYWVDIGTTVDAVYQHTFSYNQIYGRTIAPLGQVYNSPSARDIVHFRQLSRAYGSPGVSWWDWQESGRAQWRALARATRQIASSTATWQPPVLRQKMSGDLVVWAQEHLLSAGYSVKVDGVFSAKLTRVVRIFQQAQNLGVDGAIGPQTWQALLKYDPATVVWTGSGAHTPAPATAARAHRARATFTEPVPASARMRARANEIPPRLGAG